MTQFASQAESQKLLTPEFMNRIERLDVMSRKILHGKMQGERRSKRRGQSVEFADYRNYVVGDDLRFIDWNLYARLDKLFLRLFLEEEDLSVSFVMDTTASMSVGEPNKMHYTKQLVAALSYIALLKYNRVSLFSFVDTITDSLMGLRGRKFVPQMIEFIDRQFASPSLETPGDLATVCKRVAMTQQQPGVIVLVSDCFDKGDLANAMRYLGDPRHDVYVIQLLSPQEIDPKKAGMIGDLRFEDVEDGDIAEVSVTPELIDRYKANLEAYCTHIRDLCMKRNIAYMIGDTAVPIETMVMKYLREKGLLG
ncbi:hypothetical protein KS4_06890 [Poriferisphaera corsica]|uniref:DUF58 domain-containing protein n=1 Tax=Poriferisphaera corsica TaxID=2528020 RepID=A0A517YR00_9BACT|nr:DUF58 domain-containing protein [Poriferisphaera corsica]QDU32655.1 hypothetical protein KS4_06890 [Poriferisphaera corsica]